VPFRLLAIAASCARLDMAIEPLASAPGAIPGKIPTKSTIASIVAKIFLVLLIVINPLCFYPSKGIPFGGGLLVGMPISNYLNFHQKRLAFIDICVL